MIKIKFILFLFIPAILTSQIIKVPQDYTTIQSAINTANNLDTVLVSEGTYFENVKFNGKKIVLASNYIFNRDFESIKNTIINGSKPSNADSGSCVSFNGREDSNAILEGFTLTGGTGTKYGFSFGPFQEGGGVILGYSSAVIRNNIIKNNNIIAAPGAARGGGGGIASMYGNPTICNNIIYSNNAGYAGGIVLNWSSGKIINNIIYHNTGGAAYGTGGIMIWEPTTDVSVENNTIIGNISLKDAGGININSTISIVKNNLIWGNRQAGGPQVLNANRSYFNDIEDYSDANNISVNPEIQGKSFLLSDSSPCIDAGDTSKICNDVFDPQNPEKSLFPSKGFLRNDIGAFGGRFTKLLPEISVSDVYVSRTNISGLTCNVSKEILCKIELLNLSTQSVKIDSIIHVNKTDYQLDYSSKALGLFQSDTLYVSFKPTRNGSNITDTVKIYHQAEEAVNPIIITIKGRGVTPTGVDEESFRNPEYKLYNNYPNPFNPETTIRFSIKEKGPVSIRIYNILGMETRTLMNENLDAGTYTIKWKPENNISSGVYIAELVAGGYSFSKKMIYQK